MRTILFDVDGVVFHSTDGHGNFLCCQTIKADLGLDPTQAPPLFAQGWANVICGKKDALDHFTHALKSIPHVRVSAEDFMFYWLEKDVHVNKEILSLLEKIHLPVGLATNLDHHRKKTDQAAGGVSFPSHPCLL